MDSKQVEKLLDRYLEAETTVREEEELRAYFGSGQVAPHLVEYQSLFGFFNHARKEQYHQPVQPVTVNKKVVFAWVGMAACILLLAGLFLNQPSKASEFGTYEDPEIALQKTKEALNFLSRNLNSGTEELGHLQEFNNAKNELLKTNKQME